MSIQTVQVTAGTSVDLNINPFDSAFKNTEITLTGRATGIVQIKVISSAGDRFLAPSGASSIDLTSTDTLIISGSAVRAVRIDDTANTGAALTATIQTWPDNV